MSTLAGFFRFAENRTTLKTEIVAGITTFVTMAYVLAVVPKILSSTGIPLPEIIVLVCVATMLATLVMGLYTNRPFALAPGLGSVAIAASMVTTAGFTTGTMAGTIFISGLLFMIVTFFGLRDAVVRAIPASLKYAVSASVGLFIAFIGARSGHLIHAGKKALEWGDLASPNALLCLIGFMLIIIMRQKKVPGGIILSILATTLIGIPLGVTHVPEHLFSLPFNLIDAGANRLADFDLASCLNIAIVPFVIALFIPDFFSTFGTLLGVGGKAGYLDKNGNLPGMDKCFNVDSTATAVGGLFAVPCVTTYLESSAGVESGGRTGLTAVVVAVCFFLALFATPIAIMIPAAATAPALIYIGVDMLGGVRRLDFTSFEEYFPAFVCITFTILASNIANGICVAIPTYLVIKLASGKVREIDPLLYIVSLVCVGYFAALILK